VENCRVARKKNKKKKAKLLKYLITDFNCDWSWLGIVLSVSYWDVSAIAARRFCWEKC